MYLANSHLIPTYINCCFLPETPASVISICWLAERFLSICPAVRACSVAQLCLFGTLRTVACQAPLSMGFSRQEYWSELLSSRHRVQTCSDPLVGGFFTHCATWKALCPAAVPCQVALVVSDSLQSYRLCSSSGSSIHEILQAGILEWVAVAFCRGSSFLTQGWKLHLLCLLHWRASSLPIAISGKPLCPATYHNYD